MNGNSSTDMEIAAPQALEVSTAGQAAGATAMIQARFTLARRFPRNEDDVRTKLIKECKRPGFAAAQSGWYVVQVGKKFNKDTSQWDEVYAEGHSIRFAEAAGRYMGNIDWGSMVVYDDSEKRIVRVFAIDLETNFGGEQNVTIVKHAERKRLNKNQVAIGTRQNSYGETVFIVRAEEGDVVKMQAAAVSKALRVQLLRLVPGWILDETAEEMAKTREAEVKTDPMAPRRRLVDGFAKLGVKASDLAAYLGHDLDMMTEKEFVKLSAIGSAMRDEGIEWAQVIASEDESDEAKKDPKLASVAAKVAEHVKAKVKPRTPSPAAEETPKPEREPGSEG